MGRTDVGKREIDKALGIESIDSFLSDLNVDPKEAEGFHEIDENYVGFVCDSNTI